MESVDPQQFEDPALKAAVRRAWADQAAPAALRQRIANALNDAERARSRWRGPLWSLAAAAVLLVGFATSYILLWQLGEQRVPQFFAAAMVAAHDRCSAADQHLLPGAQATELAATREQLRLRVGHPVLVAMLGDGWQFAGAGVCDVSNVPAAHLLFTRGDQSVSIFSVSAGAFYANSTDGTSYAQIEQGHAVSGFVYGGAVHCLIGSSKSTRLTLKEVTRLRDQIRDAVAVADMPAQPQAH